MHAARNAFAAATFAMLLGILLFAPAILGAEEKGLEDIVNESPLTTDRDRALLNGGCEEDPYAALQREGFIGGGKVVPRRAGNTLTDGIDPALACRLLQFFRAAKACNPKITSAFRSKSDQARACIGVCGNPNGCSRGCAAPGRSCHQQGLAVDIESRCAEKMSAEARRFNLISRIPGYPNPNHYQCIEHGRSAGVSSCTGPCMGGLAITPGPDDFQPSGPPSSGLARAVRDFLNPQQEQMCSLPGGGQVPCSSIANPGAQQPLSQSQQPQLQQPPDLGTQNTVPYAPGTCPPQFYCANSTYYYRASTCVDQVREKCSAGCSSTSNTCASTTMSPLSAIDQIGLIAEPTSTPVGVVSDLLFELAISGDDVATLQDTTAPSGALSTDGSYGAPPSVSQQTFVSGDLRYSQAEQYQPQRLTTLQRTLATMRDTLLRVLAYLRPFGRPTIESEYDEWVE
ncbi:D-alanyl-D-alanine carboxypeptidase family protein [Candidatus Kaiserbacteria bacterium]|nr:D-alanyl-D-alanine carboxypeptidase family protein [Candidatus Kaiserbacteria bacterium]